MVPQFSLEPGVTLAWGSLPYGDFTARLLGSRFTVTPSARMSISSLVQFNVDAKTLSASGRLRWEYTGGSELFIVYSDGRDTQNVGFPGTAEPDLRDQGDAALQFECLALLMFWCSVAALQALRRRCCVDLGKYRSPDHQAR